MIALLKKINIIILTIFLSSLFLGIGNKVAAQANLNLGASSNAFESQSAHNNSLFTIHSSAYVDNQYPNCAGSNTQLAGGVFGAPLVTVATLVTNLNNPEQVCDMNRVITDNDPDGAALQRIFASHAKRSKNLVGSVIALNSNILKQRPVSGTEFIEQKIVALQNIGNVKAQQNQGVPDPDDLYYRGTGFDLLKPVQAFWGWSVNIVYGILIFIIIGVAFALMFRDSIGGATAVTIQNSIPNIALAMILVPLSYAITGLFIDGITLGVNVTHAFILGPGSPARPVFDNRNTTFPLDSLVTLPGVVDTPADRGLHADDIRVSWLYAGTNLGITDEFATAINELGPQFGIVQLFASLGAESIFIPIINLIVGLILLLTGLRIFWLLIQKFLIFILGPMFAPFIFATIAMPGNGVKSIVTYAKIMGSGTLYYVVAYAMILLSIVFSSSYFQNQIATVGQTTFIPPLTGIEEIIRSGAGSTNAFVNGVVPVYMALISLAIYMLIPKTLKNIDEALGANVGLSFIGDAIQSTKDSINLGKNIGVAGQKAFNAPATLNKYRTQGYQAVANAFDRLRGIKPGEEGSYEYRRRARQQARISALDAQRRAALESGTAWGAVKGRAYATLGNMAQRTAEAVDTAPGASGTKTEGGTKLEAEAAWAGQKGLIVFDPVAANAFVANKGMLFGGKITIKSNTPFFPNRNDSFRKATNLYSITEDQMKIFMVDAKGDSSEISYASETAIIRGQGYPGAERFRIVLNRPDPSNPNIVAVIDPANLNVINIGCNFIVGESPTAPTLAQAEALIEDIKNGAIYKFETQVKFRLSGVFGTQLSTSLETNPVTFNIQPAVGNIPGTQHNPIV